MQLREADATASTTLPLTATVEGPERGIALWPMENRATSITNLLHALNRGILPLLLPPQIPPARLAVLRNRYAGFGLYNGQEIEWPAQPAKAEATAYFGLLTSGSTGEPKAIVTSAERLTAGVRAIHQAQSLDTVKSSGVMLPLAYSFACVNQLFWAVLMQRELLLPGPVADLAPGLARLREWGASKLCLVGHQARLLTQHAHSLPPLPMVQVVNFAGAPFPMAQFDALTTLFPNARFYNNYGCAEAMPRLCCREVKASGEPITLVGQPVGDITLRIVGDATDASGQIQFHGSSTALGTLQADGQLSPFDAWIGSGDMGRLDVEGLHVLGRHDQVVKIGGERLSLIEVEHAFGQLGARNTLVWLSTDTLPEAVHVIAQFDAPPALAILLPALRQLLPRPLLPQTIHLARQWHFTGNQKTDAPALRTAMAAGSLEQLWPAIRA
ncbi:AMP-binding protein [Chitinimonas naiadis]